MGPAIAMVAMACDTIAYFALNVKVFLLSSRWINLLYQSLFGGLSNFLLAGISQNFDI